jgi:hypothetical protein
MARSLTLTVALDWPRSAADGRVLTDAMAAEFDAARTTRFKTPSPGVSIDVYSMWLVGNRDLPRIWRRMIRYLQNAGILNAGTDPWCYGIRVHEVDHDPHITIKVQEEP